MTDKVCVAIKGLQFASDEEDAVEVINIGYYNEINGTIYIKYEDIMEGTQDKTSNLIKITDKGVEITKKGAVNAHMSFIRDEKTMTFYDTPFGSIYLGIFSSEVSVDRNSNKIEIVIEYALELNYEQISECSVNMKITSIDKDFQLN